ncbi:30S ribosomal protein S16 [bacterium]|nr:MAG: 30S ribosomal protein S16 [bacterium]
MVRIRLQRHGRKKRPYYHIVAADIRKKRDGGIIEDLGRYNPVATPKMVNLNTERVLYWLANGAQPSESVRGLLKAEGIFYRQHLIRWGKSAEEIDQAIADWKSGKPVAGKASKAEKMREALKAEEEQVKKAQVEAAAAAKKAEEEAKVAAEAAAAAEETVEEAPAQEETPAAEESTEEQNG